MESLQKIGKLEAISIIIVVMINQVVLNLSNVIIANTGTSSWINVIYITILSIGFCLLICKLFKPFPTSDILDVSEFLGGKILKIIMGITYSILFIFIISIFLRYFATSIKLIYFQETPLVFLLILFLIPTVIVAKLGIGTICKVNLFFTPAFLLSVIVFIITAAENTLGTKIFPILGFGVKETFLVGLSNIFAFLSFGYLYFLIPKLKNPEDFKKITLTSIIISAIYLFINVICLLMIFPYFSFSDELLSVYLVSRLIEFGRFFQRADAIFIFIWILAFLSFLSFTFNIVSDILKKMLNLKTQKELVYSISAIVFGLALIPDNISIIKFIQENILKYLIILVVFVMSLIILILANLKKKRRKRNES